jgi:hypothetical protein
MASLMKNEKKKTSSFPMIVINKFEKIVAPSEEGEEKI